MRSATLRLGKIMNPRSVFTVVLLFCVLGTASQAQTSNAFTQPAGFCTLNLLVNSDTRVSITFARFPAFVGVIQSVTNNVVTVQGNPNWSPNQFVYAGGTQPNSYSLLFISGAREGQT